MARRIYAQPKLADRGKIVDQTLETSEPNVLEIDFITKTRGTAI